MLSAVASLPVELKGVDDVLPESALTFGDGGNRNFDFFTIFAPRICKRLE